MATVFDVAKYILDKTGPISTMKLQKLVYYSQAWSLVWDEAPLFNEPIQAWANGPVCPDLYYAHKGAFTIESSNIPGNVDNLSKNQKDTIDIVVDTYNKYKSSDLSAQTHRERPWIDARRRSGAIEGERSNEIIPLDEMQAYYESL